MPNLNEYHRRVRSYLEDNYGLTGLQLNWEGDHPYFKFEYKGQNHIITMNRKAEGPKTTDLKFQDIRRELGPFPFIPPKTPRKLEDMMPQEPFNPPRVLPAMTEPETQTNKEAIGTGYAASYESNHCLALTIPAEVVECLDVTPNYSIHSAAKGFEIKRGGNSKFRKRGNFYLLTASSTNLRFSPKFFGSTKAEFVAVDGHILGSLTEPPQERVPRIRTARVYKVSGVSGSTKTEHVPISTVIYTPNTGPDLLAYLQACTELKGTDIKKVVDCVNYIEERTDWRITRKTDTNKLFFQSRIE